jgi:hypothetical protein
MSARRSSACWVLVITAALLTSCSSSEGETTGKISAPSSTVDLDPVAACEQAVENAVSQYVETLDKEAIRAQLGELSAEWAAFQGVYPMVVGRLREPDVMRLAMRAIPQICRARVAEAADSGVRDMDRRSSVAEEVLKAWKVDDRELLRTLARADVPIDLDDIEAEGFDLRGLRSDASCVEESGNYFEVSWDVICTFYTVVTEDFPETAEFYLKGEQVVAVGVNKDSPGTSHDFEPEEGTGD